MLEIGSNSERSYDSDDSEINYIPCYENTEVEEATIGEVNAASLTELDVDTSKPYEDKPIPTEEWVSEYQRKQETQAEFKRKLQDHYEGKEPVNSWFFCRCNCGGCSSEYLQNTNEFQCCLEIEECVECLSREMIIEEVGTKPECITQHPGFGQVYLKKWSV